MRHLFLALLLAAGLMPSARQQAPRCFDVPGIIDCIDDRFRTYWEQNGGLAVFGYPIGPATMHESAEGSFWSQNFERNRLELHPENAAPYKILLGRLGEDRLRQLGRNWRDFPEADPSTPHYFRETGHAIAARFWDYWRGHGLDLGDSGISERESLALFGLPLSEPATETNAAGDTVLTQWFERARFEYHPNQPSEFKVLLGLLGRETLAPVPGTGGRPFDPASFVLVPRRVATGLREPVHVTGDPGDPRRLFVVEKPGRIRVVSIADGIVRGEPFLDITDRVGARGSEQGLFAVAFHPDYRRNGLFFVHYTDRNGDTVIARYRVSDDPNRADPATARTVLTVDQPYPNHNGGQIAFGPDGYLYIGLGDGGSSGDPQGNGQSLRTLLGKILRIDVDRGDPYAIPPDNPFRSTAGARGEIWAYGLRNPWRFSFDRATGDLFVGDVGQNRKEEISWSGGNAAGVNYGWNTMEASDCFRPATGCVLTGLTLPIAEYEHSLGCSVTGGFRYRGRAVAAFGTAYFFGDYCSGRIWALTPSGTTWKRSELLDTEYNISSFGEDSMGELYFADFGGSVYRLEARDR